MPKQLWLIVGAILFLAFLWGVSEILFPFVAGLALAYLLDPAVDWMERKGMPRWAAATVMTICAVLAVVGVLLLLAPMLYHQLIGLVDRAPDYIEELRDGAISLLARLQESLSAEQSAALKQKVQNLAGPDSLKWLGGVVKRLWGGGLAIVNLLSLLVITPIVLFYMLRDWDRIVASVDGLLPRDYAKTIREVVREIDRVLAGFVRGQLTVCIVLGIFYAFGLILVGLEFGLIIGLLTGLISFVPYFGMLIGFALGIAVAIAQFDGWLPILIVAAIFAAGQIIEGNFVTPKVVGDQVGLHPAWMIFALMAGGTLFGFTGVLLAVPVAAVVGVLSRFAAARYRESGTFTGGGGT